MKATLVGAKEVERTILSLSHLFTHKELQDVHAIAAKPLIEAEKLLAPEGPNGFLVDSIGSVREPMGTAQESGQLSVGPRRGRYKGHHAHLVEYGTKKRATLGNGKYRAGTNRGVMPAKPFAKPAWDKTQGQVRQRIADQLSKRVIGTMRSNLKK